MPERHSRKVIVEPMEVLSVAGFAVLWVSAMFMRPFDLIGFMVLSAFFVAWVRGLLAHRRVLARLEAEIAALAPDDPKAKMLKRNYQLLKFPHGRVWSAEGNGSLPSSGTDGLHSGGDCGFHGGGGGGGDCGGGGHH